MTEAQYLAMQAEWEAAGPPAPMTTEAASWLILAVILAIALLAIGQGWLD